MAELKFVIRCFVSAVAILLFCQLQIGSRTIEAHIESTLVNTQVARFINKTANGGVSLIRDAGAKAKEVFLGWKSQAIKRERVRDSNLNGDLNGGDGATSHHSQ